jgi:hypothetical protein
MKKRDLILVIIVLMFGIGYNAVKEGELTFFAGGCNIIDNRKLIDKEHMNPFPQANLDYAAGEFDKIEVINAAGSIRVVKANDNRITVQREIRVYHRDKSRAERYLDDVDMKVYEGTNRNGLLKIVIEPENRFPYRRVRVMFVINVPESVELDLWNRYGDVSIDGTGKDIAVNNYHGDIAIQEVASSLKVRHRHGKVVLRDISGLTTLNSRHSRVSVTDVDQLKLSCAYARVSIEGVKGKTEIDYSRHTSLRLENISGGLVADARHTRFNVKNIKNGVTISNSHDTVSLEDIQGDVTIDANDCRIGLEKVVADEIKLKNKYDHIRLNQINARQLYVQLSHGNLELDFIKIEELLNIKNRHSNIHLAYPKDTHPGFNIELTHGKIQNETDDRYDITIKRPKLHAVNTGNSPRISIDNLYGNVYLKNNSFDPLMETEKAIPVQKVETEEFEKIDENKTDNASEKNIENKTESKTEEKTVDNTK